MNWTLQEPGGMDRAIRWMQGLLNTLKDGGTWAVPRAKTVYQFSKTKKSCLRLIGDGDKAIEIVLEKMGWDLETNPGEDVKSSPGNKQGQ